MKWSVPLAMNCLLTVLLADTAHAQAVSAPTSAPASAPSKVAKKASNSTTIACPPQCMSTQDTRPGEHGILPGDAPEAKATNKLKAQVRNTKMERAKAAVKPGVAPTDHVAPPLSTVPAQQQAQ